ncbi:DNA packaging protein [Fluviibacterium sp. S390]|uniref:DNA packaging protein n=1 Tax=Fluviibacterium sp. S390 TaxID=3415139 RepID=UPI003C7DA1D0
MRILSELPLEGDAVHRIGGKDLCTLLDISSGALSELKAKGIAVHLSHDAYDLCATVGGYVRHLRAMAAQWGTEDQAANLTAERARLAKEQADAQALKNGVARAELVKADEVVREWAEVLRKIRAGVLAVPARLRGEIPDLTAAELEKIDREIRSTLEGLAHDADS